MHHVPVRFARRVPQSLFTRSRKTLRQECATRRRCPDTRHSRCASHLLLAQHDGAEHNAAVRSLRRAAARLERSIAPRSAWTPTQATHSGRLSRASSPDRSHFCGDPRRLSRGIPRLASHARCSERSTWCTGSLRSGGTSRPPPAPGPVPLPGCAGSCGASGRTPAWRRAAHARAAGAGTSGNPNGARAFPAKGYACFHGRGLRSIKSGRRVARSVRASLAAPHVAHHRTFGAAQSHDPSDGRGRAGVLLVAATGRRPSRRSRRADGPEDPGGWPAKGSWARDRKRADLDAGASLVARVGTGKRRSGCQLGTGGASGDAGP